MHVPSLQIFDIFDFFNIGHIHWANNNQLYNCVQGVVYRRDLAMQDQVDFGRLSAPVGELLDIITQFYN